MENGVYRPTTEADPGPARAARSVLGGCVYPGRLPWPRRILKSSQLLLSLLAFVCEEVVSQCTLCGGLYFFEFVSCCAFLLSLLILIVYCTPIYDRIDAEKIRQSDFYITVVTGVVFLLASIIFTTTHDRTPTETAAIVFGFGASFMFLVDFIVMLFKKRQDDQLRKSELPLRTEAATEPLNAPR
ncbi:CKLF-like MARVEL transmembrane domain-containing protein 6 [Echinops telfairi]|uniref:CKLF-like MARVEL transmembrane domain-containing protein 6 n=1 Tax=Echinops telfairi TaxID=9371 RepID=A0ABM0INP8_ECHTE|nr:CKLF-like MARVEL transmembrane domain-containing protein 6 [Echinops telfairi]